MNRAKWTLEEYSNEEIARFNHYTKVRMIEMNLFNLYVQLKDGKISRARFDREAKRWNDLWEITRPTLPNDTRADIDAMEAVLELQRSLPEAEE